MSVLALFLLLAGAMLAQLAALVGASVWRRHASVSEVPAAALDEDALKRQGAWAGWREFRVARREYEDATRSQCSFYLEPADGEALAPFKPGQYLTFNLLPGEPATEAGPPAKPIVRCYSISDAPQATHYRITIKRVPAPVARPELPAGVSSNYFHDQVQVGAVLKLRAPSGPFHIDPDPLVPVVLIGGGIGVTPMLSMLRWCLVEQPQRMVHLYYGLRHGGEHAFKQVLESLAAAHPNFQLNIVYSSAGPNDTLGRDYQHAGFIDVDLLRRTLPHGRQKFYVCGPPPMMASLVPALAAWGVAVDDIHFEAFGPASVPALRMASNEPLANLTATVPVKLLRSGRTLQWDGLDANLLEFAERHDVSVESGCRNGSCGSCETRLLAGTVAYAQPPDYKVATGHCLLCVGKPQSAIVLEA